jgi:hypothetical protein
MARTKSANSAGSVTMTASAEVTTVLVEAAAAPRRRPAAYT